MLIFHIVIGYDLKKRCILHPVRIHAKNLKEACRLVKNMGITYDTISWSTRESSQECFYYYFENN